MTRNMLTMRPATWMVACLVGIVLALLWAPAVQGTEKAWADESVKQVTEDMLEPGEQKTSPDDLPGFTTVSVDDAKTLFKAQVNRQGLLIYAIDANSAVHFISVDGTPLNVDCLTHDDVLGYMKNHGVYYTTGGPTYKLMCQVWDITDKKPQQGGTVSDGGDFATFLEDTFQLNHEVTLTAQPDEGYDFAGWVTNLEEGDDPSAVESDVNDNPFTFAIYQNSLVAAKFQKQVHTVTFDSMGGTDVPAVQVTHGEKVSRPDPAPKKGDVLYVIDWYTDKEHTQAFDFSDTPITEDITLYAGWGGSVLIDSEGDDYGLVSIDDNEPYLTDYKQVFEGSTVTLKAKTSMETIFVNITCKDTGKVVSTEPEYAFTYDGSMSHFVATFQPNMTTLIYDLNGGSHGTNPPPHAIDVRVGGSFAEKPVPTSHDDWAYPPDGYVFDGFQIIDDKNNVYNFKPGDDMEYIYVGPTVVKMMWAPKSSDVLEKESDDKGNDASAQSDSGDSSQSKSTSPKTGDPLSAVLPLTVSAVAALAVLALCGKKRRENR